MPFDPSKSFTVVEEPPETKAGGFDPSKPFTVVQEGDTPSGRAYAPPPGTSAGSAAAPVRPPTQAFPTEQTQAEAISRIPALSAAETEEIAMTPQLRVPQSVKKVLGDIVAAGVPGGQLPPVRAAIQGPVNTAAGGLEFLSAPAAGPIAAAQMVPGLNVAVDALFAKQLTESGSQKLGEASVTGDITKATEGLGELLMAGTAGISGGRSIKDVPTRAKDFLREQAKPGPQPPPLLRRSEAELQAMPTERTANAIQERSATDVPVEAPPGDSAKVGERVPEPKTSPISQDTGQHVDQPQAKEAVLGDVKMSPGVDKPIGPLIWGALKKDDLAEAQRLADTLPDPQNRGMFGYSDAGNMAGLLTSDARVKDLSVRGTPMWEWIQQVREAAEPKKEAIPSEPKAQEETQGLLTEQQPAFAARFDPETLLQRPAWVKPGEGLDKALGATRDNPEAGKDITLAWKSLSPEQRQDLLARGWTVRDTRTPGQVVLGISQDAIAARKYFAAQRKSKPAPPPAEQAPQPAAPTAGMVSQAQASGAATPESPPAKISEATTKLSQAQPEIAAAKRPEGKPKETFEEYHARLEREKSSLIARNMAKVPKDAIAIKLQERATGKAALVTPDPTETGKWRLTYLTSKGEPWGHAVLDTRDEAIQSGLGIYGEKYGPPHLSQGYEVVEAKAPRKGVERPPDIIDVIKERVGTIRSRSAAKAGSEGYYTPEFMELSKSGASRELFSKTGQSPDEAVDTLRREGFLGPDATVDDLREAISKANAQRRVIFRGETPEVQADKFQAALEKQGAKKSSHVISVGDLGIGDKFRIQGEELEVVSIDPDTGEVTVKDGRKFGYQTIPDGADVPIEKGSLEAKAKVPAFTKEDFALNAPESVAEQKARLAREAEQAKKKAEQEQITEGAQKPLIGSTGDIGQKEMFGGGDLFSEAKPVGMGGATPEEFSKPGTIVSNMFAAIDRDRAEMGKPPMEPGEPRTWDQDRQIATARMNRDPQWIPDLIKEVNAKPRPLMSWEQAGMVMQKAYWKAEANNALRRISQAADDGRQADLAQARNDAARWEDNLAAMEEAVGRGGTGSEAGRSLKAQQMGLTDDLSLVEMRLEMRGKLGGRKLTPAEGAEIERIHKDYQQKVAALEKTAAEADRRRVDAETRATLAELARQAAQEKVPPPHIQRIIERIRSSIKSEADAARERLKGKLFTLSPDVVADLARVGADNILTIGEDFARWSAKMIEDIGEKVKPHLQMAWDEALKLINRKSDVESGGQRKVAQTVKITVKKFDTPDQKISKLTERVRSRVGQAGKPITPAVQGLARAFVQKGIRDREALIDAVHDVIKDIIPDWTRRKTMDAISGYGDYRVLSKDEVSLALRDMKGQMQQIAKLEDMAEGEAPLRSGVEQREVTKAQQELIKLVNEAKRKGGYQTTDPETQLRTALDEVKKRTQTAIEDYERRLREGDFSVRKLSPIKPDAELLAKQADLKRVRRDWEQAKRQKELANRALWQRFLDRLVRWERAFKLSSPVVFGKLAAAALTRFAETAATETVGKAIKVLPEISTVARQAPREGAGLNVKAAAHALREAFTKGMRDAAQTARKGAADIDVEYGEKLIDRDWVNFFGQLHGMMKAPVKRAEFEYALQQRIEHAIRNGLDPTDPLVAARLHAEALSDGYRSIFMQRGFSSDMFNQLVSQMEKSKKYPVAGEITARTARFLMPIVRVPANIVAETATGIHGLPTASARTMFHAIRGTLGELDPIVADSIMRQFKKGSIGLGLMAIGFFNPTSIGGYDWREKRALGAVKTAGFQIGGVDIPRWMTHAPWFELMQFGATIRHVMEQHVKGEPKGIGEGMWAAGVGLIEETPFVGQMLRVDKLFESAGQRDAYLGELLRSTLEPQLLIKAAQLTDTRFGEPVARKPKTIMEHVKMGIPGLRGDVPEKTTK